MSNYVPTYTSKKIVEALTYAQDFSALVTVTGETGRGKTLTAQTFVSLDTDTRFYIRVPSGATRKAFVRDLHRAVVGKCDGATADLETRLAERLTPRHVVIIDEAGHLLPKPGQTRTTAIEFVRDLHDRCGCGVVLIYTNVYLARMKTGNLTDYFEQFNGRIKYPCNIPNGPRKDDVRAIVRSFEPNADEPTILKALAIARANDGKLRILTEDLRRATDFAKSKGEILSVKWLKLVETWRTQGGAWEEDV